VSVTGVALAAIEMAAAEVAVGLHVSHHGLDRRATPQFALDDAEDAALLTRDEDTTRIGCVVVAIALVDIGALDRAAGELLGGINDAAERKALSLALADAFDLGGVEGIELPPGLTLLLRSDLRSTRERRFEDRREFGPSGGNLAADVADVRPSRLRSRRNWRWWRLNCLAWA
jgi:hypothetical protein